MVDGFAKTPRYVLKDGSHPTCPLISRDSSGVETTAIFGFSDKPEYDVFLDASTLALTPYPIVKRFLQVQIDLDIDALKLIVLGAVSPHQLVFQAATMQAVLEAFELGSDCVAVSHQLILDESSTDYRVQVIAAVTPERSAP